ncbi:MAG TPA: hypothetical protein GXZ43_04995 [Clostridiaceae bacterium]|nr:hypothetical protein [Clostridiaceae bacterium]
MILLLTRKPFTGERWQEPRYLKSLCDLGYTIEKTYYSHHYPAKAIQDSEVPPKFRQRYKEAIGKGYAFSTAKGKDFNEVIMDIYELLVPLYVNFPIGKNITKEAFTAMFKPLQHLIDPDLLHLVRWHGKLVAVLLTLPDYGTLPYGNPGLLDILKILWLKKYSKHYIHLYMAVAKGHESLGQAIMYLQYLEIKKRKAGTTAALVHQGKLTGIYGKALENAYTEYLLLSKKLE